MKYLYKYPQAEFPYARLVEENRRRDKHEPGVRAAGHRRLRGKPLLRRLRGVRQGRARGHPGPHRGHQSRSGGGGAAPAAHGVVPQHAGPGDNDERTVRADLRSGRRSRTGASRLYGRRWLDCEGRPELLFTENETNLPAPVRSPERRRHYVKDGIDDYVVHGNGAARSIRRARH